jgi:hypothetical protein
MTKIAGSGSTPKCHGSATLPSTPCNKSKLDTDPHSLSFKDLRMWKNYRVPNHPSLPLHVTTAGKNHLSEEIIPQLPSGKGMRNCQTISNLGHAAPM